MTTMLLNARARLGLSGRLLAGLGLAMLLLVGLSGCATTRWVESQVSSYATEAVSTSGRTAAHLQPRYRLLRLPSQQAHAEAFAPIEEQAHLALARAGLRRDDAQPQWLVELGVEVGETLPRDWPYYAPDPFYARFGWGGMRGGWSLGMHWMMDGPPTLHRRKVSLVMRDAHSQQVVYETSAQYEDIWRSDPQLYGVLFDHALSGFPNPPSGVRTLRTELTPTAPRLVDP